MIKDIPVQGYFNIKSQELLKNTEYEGYNKKKVIEAEIFKDMEKYLK